MKIIFSMGIVMAGCKKHMIVIFFTMLLSIIINLAFDYSKIIVPYIVSAVISCALIVVCYYYFWSKYLFKYRVFLMIALSVIFTYCLNVFGFFESVYGNLSCYISALSASLAVSFSRKSY